MIAARFLGAVALFVSVSGCPSARAAVVDFPNKPLRFLVGFAPGGGADIVTRAISGRLSDVLGQQVIVDNRPGAGGNIATAILTKSDADGHTLLMASIGMLSINPSLYPGLPFSIARDLAPVTKAADSTNILCLHPSVGVGSVRELIELAKGRSLNAGSSGVGTTGHLAIELFNSMTGLRMVHIPYKGGGQVMLDLIAGNIHLIFSNPAAAMAHIQAGRVKPIAVTTAKRLQVMPELPTVAESGVPGFEANNWIGVVVPAGTPRTRIDRLNREIAAILDTTALRDFLLRQGFEADPGTPAAFDSFIKAETMKWANVVKASGAKGE